MDPSPFNSADADVILRTSDGISLKVHSRILIEASTFFRDLFTLPQPPASDNSLPACVDISERGKVVHMLLMFTYPFEEPQIDSLPLLGDILGTAVKYDMGRAVQAMRRLLVSPTFLQKEPLRVYAIACRHNFEAEAKSASTGTLTINLLSTPLAEELKHVTAYDYHRLLQLHHTRGTQAKKLLVWKDTAEPCHYNCSSPSRWWTDFVARAEVELQHAPTTDVIFSMPFLAQSAGARCSSCGSCIIKSHAFLDDVKKAIDALPATI